MYLETGDSKGTANMVVCPPFMQNLGHAWLCWLPQANAAATYFTDCLTTFYAAHVAKFALAT